MYDIKGWDPIFQFQLTDHIIENDKLNCWLLINRRFPDNSRTEDENAEITYRISVLMHYKVIQPVLLTMLNYKNVCISVGTTFHSSFLKEDEKSFSIIGGLSQYNYTISRYWVQVISLLKQYYSIQMTKISRIGLYKITKQRDLERFATLRGINYYNNRIIIKDPDFKPYENVDIFWTMHPDVKYHIMSISNNHINNIPFAPNRNDNSSTNFFYSKIEKNFCYKNKNHIKFMNTENTCYKNNDGNFTKNILPYSIRLKNFNDMLYYCIVTANNAEIINGYKNKIMNEYDRKIVDKVRNHEMVTNIEFLNPNDPGLPRINGEDLVESVFDIIGWSGSLIDRNDDAIIMRNYPYHDSVLYFDSYSTNIRFPIRSSIRFTYKYQC